MGRSQAQLATIGRCRTVTEPLSFLNSLSTRLRAGGPVTPSAPPPVNYENTKQFGLAQLAEFNTCSIAVAEQWQGWQGWRSGESTCLPPMWPGFDFRTRRQMWIEFVGSLLCYERFFPGTPVFPSPQKPTFDLISFDL